MIAFEGFCIVRASRDSRLRSTKMKEMHRMAYIITQSCCNDATCVAVCPVNCIHPTPEERDFSTAEMLHIDPDSCIDCGACAEVCPVDAIISDGELAEETALYAELNADYFTETSPTSSLVPSIPLGPASSATGAIRVAVIGTGPAACYAVEELLNTHGVQVGVSVFERLPVPGGLVRYGVAPDHPSTKEIAEVFERTICRGGVRVFLNTRVGEHITHDELMSHHDAVIYAVGASEDRRLAIPGESLPGSHSATDFVAWYNGHPDFAGMKFDFSSERAVVIGNGNVGLDVARVLVSDVSRLARTDIADHAIEALATSKIKEVIVVGRRGPAHAAFTVPELAALGHLPQTNVTADPVDSESAADSKAAAGMKQRIIADYAARSVVIGDRTIRLRFFRTPVEILGTSSVEGIRMARTQLLSGSDSRTEVFPDSVEDWECGLALRSIGYRARALAGLPFDGDRGVVPNDGGRVIDAGTGSPIPGVYVAGWVKRGPSGLIGTNRLCARETVRHLLEDLEAGRLVKPTRDTAELEALIEQRQPDRIDIGGWRSIKAHEVEAGRKAGRPRVKLVRVEDMVGIANRQKALA
ncbi:FAD-dependent oxidoreductase [Nocardia nova]|uniref:FAD-dependent oxidoreductase n=1 Tax=Nocardia nova TaxID=37330 RepID=UPI00379E2810